jgi:2-polyprenyl-3-methyl-5-hydroxy-6-metoxy-1,4-benzoquinol methylase
VLDKIKKMLMKKENNPPLTDPRDTGEEKEWNDKSDAEQAEEIAAYEADQEEATAQNEFVEEEEITDLELEAAKERLALNREDEVTLVDGATELQPTDDEKNEMKNPSDFDEDYLEYSSEAVGFENREEQWNTYRLIANYIQDNESVLDFGCARGDFERFYQTEYGQELEYVGVDMNQQLINAGNKVYNEEVEPIFTY